MTYSRVTYLVGYGIAYDNDGVPFCMNTEEFMTLHQALDFAQPKLLMGEEVLITPNKTL